MEWPKADGHKVRRKMPNAKVQISNQCQRPNDRWRTITGCDVELVKREANQSFASAVWFGVLDFRHWDLTWHLDFDI